MAGAVAGSAHHERDSQSQRIYSGVKLNVAALNEAMLRANAIVQVTVYSDVEVSSVRGFPSSQLSIAGTL